MPVAGFLWAEAKGDTPQATGNREPATRQQSRHAEHRIRLLLDRLADAAFERAGQQRELGFEDHFGIGDLHRSFQRHAARFAVELQRIAEPLVPDLVGLRSELRQELIEGLFEFLSGNVFRRAGLDGNAHAKIINREPRSHAVTASLRLAVLALCSIVASDVLSRSNEFCVFVPSVDELDVTVWREGVRTRLKPRAERVAGGTFLTLDKDGTTEP